MNSQWTSTPNFDLVSKYKVMTRDDLRQISQSPGIYTSKTSGSTGEQVSVEKYYEDIVWSKALSYRSLIWSGMDPSLNVCQVRTSEGTGIKDNWGLPEWFAKRQGKIFYTKNTDIDSLQKWIDRKKPHYIQCFPSVAEQLNTSKLPDFKGFFGTGEIGGNEYSSEEFGLIASRCPDNLQNYHVSENIIIELDNDGSAIITNIHHPYLKRYKIGDILSLGKCSCGRALQTITSISGRTRNLITYPDGRRQWPMIGSKEFYSKFKIKRFQAVQKSLKIIEISVIAEPFDEKEFKKFVNSSLGYEFDIRVSYVYNFPIGKFEEFKSLI